MPNKVLLVGIVKNLFGNHHAWFEIDSAILTCIKQRCSILVINALSNNLKFVVMR